MLQGSFYGDRPFPESGSSAATSVRKQPFTDDEDAVIRSHVQSHGPRAWTDLESELEGRTAKQCRERWYHHLDPAIRKGGWTRIEDEILLKRRAQLGNRWADIARFLPGRTGSMVKNRWHSVLRRGLEPAQRAPGEAPAMDIGEWLSTWEHGRPAPPQQPSEWMPAFVERNP
jgi:hypothetical protein